MAKMLAEFSKALMAVEPGKNLEAVYPDKLAGSGWQSAPVIQKSSWRPCRVTKVDLVQSTICAARAAEFFVPRMAAKHGPARARSIRARFTSVSFASIQRTISESIFWGSPCWSQTMVEKPFARI